MNCQAKMPVAIVRATENTAYGTDLDNFRSKHSDGMTAFTSAVDGTPMGPLMMLCTQRGCQVASASSGYPPVEPAIVFKPLTGCGSERRTTCLERVDRITLLQGEADVVQSIQEPVLH